MVAFYRDTTCEECVAALESLSATIVDSLDAYVKYMQGPAFCEQADPDSIEGCKEAVQDLIPAALQLFIELGREMFPQLCHDILSVC